jgi:hypothetical protein
MVAFTLASSCSRRLHKLAIAQHQTAAAAAVKHCEKQWQALQGWHGHV